MINLHQTILSIRKNPPVLQPSFHLLVKDTQIIMGSSCCMLEECEEVLVSLALFWLNLYTHSCLTSFI